MSSDTTVLVFCMQPGTDSKTTDLTQRSLSRGPVPGSHVNVDETSTRETLVV